MIFRMVSRHAKPPPWKQITNLSELFVSWNELVSEAEDAVTKLEKKRDESLDIS